MKVTKNGMTMKKLINKSTFLLSLLLVTFVACDDVEIVQINPEANTVLSLSANSVVLTEDSADTNVLTVNWTDPDFGFDAAPSYTVMIDVNGGDFTAAQLVPVGSATEKVFTGAELNNKLLSLGLAPDVETSVSLKIRTVLSAYQEMVSEAVSLTVTPYSSLLDLSTNLGVVGSATPGGWGNEDIPDLPFYTTSSPNVYVAYVTLRDGFIKFRKDNLWTENWGDDGANGSLEPGGADIAVTAGTYKITANLVDLTWSMEEYSWGLVGSATTNGWDGPDMMMQYNSFQDNWKAVVTLADGEMKFRFNDDWGLNYGDTGADGSLEVNGDNIAVSAGHYIVTLDLNNLVFEIEEVDVWGLVGSATANGWDGPNQKFVPDFGINEGYYYIQGAVLTDGEIKVRQNDAWGVNYGDDGNDGTMELNGANILVTAGTYNITLNFSVEPPTISIYPW
jgi:starch-binding outer membrane protein SusE/F